MRGLIFLHCHFFCLNRGGAPCILAVYPWNYARTFLSILARILARILAVGILGILGILGVRILGILGMSL